MSNEIYLHRLFHSSHSIYFSTFQISIFLNRKSRLYLSDYSVDGVDKVENVHDWDDLVFPIFCYLDLSHSSFKKNLKVLFRVVVYIFVYFITQYLYRVSTLHLRCQSLISFGRPGWCCDHILLVKNQDRIRTDKNITSFEGRFFMNFVNLS